MAKKEGVMDGCDLMLYIDTAESGDTPHGRPRHWRPAIQSHIIRKLKNG